MTKCDICNANIKELLMGKIKGTYVRENKKLLKICSDCQKTYKKKVK